MEQILTDGKQVHDANIDIGAGGKTDHRTAGSRQGSPGLFMVGDMPLKGDDKTVDVVRKLIVAYGEVIVFLRQVFMKGSKSLYDIYQTLHVARELLLRLREALNVVSETLNVGGRLRLLIDNELHCALDVHLLFFLAPV
jgi:hypothetical protein